ncbi:hypothetical protein FB645_000327 [Coemansia sp. IMI 203386]|nr:hypothetical protein FB645_000327 [Coemansia sp. IMI 203386]
MCDPTDIPSVYTQCSENQFTPAMLAKTNNMDMYMADSQAIPMQLLTPPMSPIDNKSADVFEDRPVCHGQNVLWELPSPILLLIVSHLRLPEIIVLSQTCSTLRNYLSAESHIWSHICRSTLSYTPRLLYNRQIAEYYLRVRGDYRTESKVLLHRERIERIIQHIVHSQAAV